MEKTDSGLPFVPRTFEQAAKQIVQYISAEQLKAGDRLPPERRMSRLLQVSRSSVREGLRVLEMLKYVESRHGGGTYVAEPPPYIIPAKFLDEKIETGRLDHYFKISLVLAEHVVFSSFGKSIDSNGIETNSFWIGFDQLVTQLSKQSDNPFFLSLWSDSFSLLNANHYFVALQHSFSIGQFIHCFLSEDQAQLKDMFSKIREIL